MHICPFLIANAKTAKLIQPCEGAFHDPAPSPQPATVFRIALCEQVPDVAGAQSTADGLRVVGPVPQHAVRATARPTTRPLERRNAIEQWYSLG